VALDWSRITFTEHMTEAAAVVGECQVVIDFSPSERAAYEIKVYESLKGATGDRYFALGTNREEPDEEAHEDRPEDVRDSHLGCSARLERAQGRLPGRHPPACFTRRRW